MQHRGSESADCEGNVVSERDDWKITREFSKDQHEKAS